MCRYCIVISIYVLMNDTNNSDEVTRRVIGALIVRFAQKDLLQFEVALITTVQVGMKKEWIMSEEARLEKKQRVQENRERRLAEAATYVSFEIPFNFKIYRFWPHFVRKMHLECYCRRLDMGAL